METETVAVFRETDHVLDADEFPAEDAFHGFDEAVCCPAGEFVERDEVVAAGTGIGAGEEGWTGPDVAEGDAVEGGAGCGPDGVEAVDEDVPESGDGDGAGVSVGLAFGLEEIWDG